MARTAPPSAAPRPARSSVRSFESILTGLVGDPLPLATGLGCRNSKGRVCTLCWGSRLTYAHETRFKVEALARWADQIASLPPPQFIASPQGRMYRSVSKRRWIHERKLLAMVEGIERGRILGIAPAQCQIEPGSHAALYTQLQNEFSHSSLARFVNYAIIKSGVDGEVLVLNLSDMRSQRAELNRISKKLTHHNENLKAIWLIQGQEGDEYYANIRPGQWQKLHGENHLATAQNLHYSPLCFSQVNPHVVPIMLEATQKWLAEPALPMLDLYSGYGLFSLGMPRTGPTQGFELSGEAVLWARRNARRLKREGARFDPWDLATMELPERRFPSGAWVAVLDPPRSGAPVELIKHLTRMRPKRVMHWICDINEFEDQLRGWTQNGYRVTEALALDMFPGTNSLELGLCLEPGGRLKTAKPSHLINKAGTTSECIPPKKPAISRATSTASGPRPKRPKR
jgi:tRNA/tmRNA/rRNA uracil-C5-methylase (TrmA/RlmC/RlmD family)